MIMRMIRGMTVTIDELKNLRDYHAQIACLRARIARLEEASFCAPSPTLSHAPKAAGSPADPTGKAALELVRLKAELQQKVVELESRISRIEKDIDALPPRERAVIRARYMEGLSWGCVARKVHYSEDYCKEIHGAAIKNLTPDTGQGSQDHSAATM